MYREKDDTCKSHMSIDNAYRSLGKTSGSNTWFDKISALNKNNTSSNNLDKLSALNRQHNTIRLNSNSIKTRRSYQITYNNHKLNRQNKMLKREVDEMKL